MIVSKITTEEKEGLSFIRIYASNNSIKNPGKLAVVVPYACSPNTWESEARGIAEIPVQLNHAKLARLVSEKGKCEENKAVFANYVLDYRIHRKKINLPPTLKLSSCGVAPGLRRLDTALIVRMVSGNQPRFFCP